MKKPLFLFLVPTLLFSCSSKDVLSKDKEILSNEKNIKEDVSDFFDSALTCQKGEEKFFVRFSLKAPKKEYHQTKVLLTCDDSSFYYFGYDSISYTLVTKKEERNEKDHKYYGIGINFTFSKEVSSVKVLFSSQEERFVFMQKC